MKSNISVCIPTYNSEIFIKQALQSVISQTVVVDQIIVCDNHSDDNTVKLVKQFQSEHKDSNISIHVNSENLGWQKNFLKCYELAKGDYFLILESDDMLKRDSIKKLRDFLQDNPTMAFVSGNVDQIDVDGNILKEVLTTKTQYYNIGEIYKFVKETNTYITVSTVLFRKDFIDKIGFYSEENVVGDELYWLYVLQHYPFAILGEGLVNQRIHPGQLHNENFLNYKEMISGNIYLGERIASLENDPKKRKEIKKIFYSSLSDMCITAGISVGQNQHKFKIALIYFISAIKYNPRIFLTKRYMKSTIKTFLIVFHLYPKKNKQIK